jgi:ABC-2 type transport system permease protein
LPPVNVVGARTLLGKEVRRFFRVPGQTVLSPLISTSLYFVVFGYSLGGSQHQVEGIPYLDYIVPGLVFLGLANNAFLNTSSSLFIAKLQGTVVDLLAAPLGPSELLIGFIGGGVIRGSVVGILTWVVASLFTGFHVLHIAVALFFLLISSYVFSMLGLLAALWAEKFEQVSFFPTFVMLPLTFLGGIFYSVNALPEPFHTISLFNPMVYMVDGVRFGFLGQSSLSPVIGAGILLSLALASTGLAFGLLRSGYKLKS